MIFDKSYLAPHQALRANESLLKEDLYTMRQAIDQFTQDKGKAPQSLDDIVVAGYLHSIPQDPFTHSAETWQVTQEDVLTTPAEKTSFGITDVKSGARPSSDGTAYSSW
jgi:general secretion pathway protein G